MAVTDSLKGLFNRKRSIDAITVDELRREKIRMEQEEAKLSRQVEELEKQKQQVFLKGKDEASERQMRILATKIKELDVQAANLDKTMRFISKQLRIVNGFIQIKENKRLLEQVGIANLISRIDMDTLQKYVDDASVEGAFRMDKFQKILGTVEDGESIVSAVDEDKDILEIMRAMQEAKQAEIERPEGIEDFARQKLDQVLHPEKAQADL